MSKSWDIGGSFPTRRFFTPSPLTGEGWGEGEEAGTSLCFGVHFNPLSPTLSHQGRGG